MLQNILNHNTLMETFLLIGITIVAAIWIIRKENKKLKNTCRLHRANKTFSEECVKLLKYEKIRMLQTYRDAIQVPETG